MKVIQSIATVALLATVNAFVTPQHTLARSQVSLAAASSSNDEDRASMGDVMKGLAFTALFGLSMIANPLPSMADGT